MFKTFGFKRVPDCNSNVPKNSTQNSPIAVPIPIPIPHPLFPAKIPKYITHTNTKLQYMPIRCALIPIYSKSMPGCAPCPTADCQTYTVTC